MESSLNRRLVPFVFSLILFSYGSFLTHGDQIICGKSQFNVDLPLRFFLTSHLLGGDLPWINNAVAGSQPIWANPQTSVFYPGNLLYLVFSMHNAWNLFLLLHLWWGSLGVYWLTRRSGYTHYAAMTGAFTFAFSSQALSLLNSTDVLSIAAWIPWITGCGFFALRNGGRMLIFAAASLAAQWLAGMNGLQLMTVVFLLLLAFYFRSKVVWLRLGAVLAMAGALSAVQWIPAIFWLPHATNIRLPDFSSVGTIGFVPIGLVILGLKRKIVWIAVALMAVAFVIPYGPVLFAYALAAGAASGIQALSDSRFMRFAPLAPLLVLVELLSVNWNIPQTMHASLIDAAPDFANEIRDIKKRNVYRHSSKIESASMIGLHLGLRFGALADPEYLQWKVSLQRSMEIQKRLIQQESLELLRECGIEFIFSWEALKHHELMMLRRADPQKSSPHCYRLTSTRIPLVRFENTHRLVRWIDLSPDRMLIQTEYNEPGKLLVYRNALPGWRCTMDDRILPISVTQNGWMEIQVPGGKHQLDLVYRTPGAYAGSIISATTTILMAVALIL